MTAVLTAEGVARTFAGHDGVTGVDLAITAGEIVALVGLNGAGKTTLMRLLLGMLRPSSGRVLLDGTELARVAPSSWSSVGHLVEAPLAYPELRVRDVLAMNARLRGVVEPERVAEAALDAFRLRPAASKRVRALSLGNRQRVGLAAALQHGPRLVILDEPTNALDPAGVILLREKLRVMAQDGAAILVSSHHLDEVARIADRILVMNAGRLIGTLDPAGEGLEARFFAMLLADHEEEAA